MSALAAEAKIPHKTNDVTIALIGYYLYYESWMNGMVARTSQEHNT